MSAIEFAQSVEQGSSAVREQINELREKITDSSFTIRETCGPDDRSYEMRHYRASMIRWQENGSVLLVARSAEMTPNEGYLDIKSSGYMHMNSGHNIKLIAEGCQKTGGGEAFSDDNKGVEIKSVAGDILVQSNGKGGIVINATGGDLELIAGKSIIMKAADQISLNTGSQDPVPFGLTESIGSGKLSISTGQYELSTASYKETVTGSKTEENFGEVIREQKPNLLAPAALGEGAHITTEETTGTLVHKIGHDYILDIGGKMKVKVANSLEKKVGPLFAEMPEHAVAYEITGSRTTTLNPDPILQFAQDYTSIPTGNWFAEIDTAMPGTSGFSAGTLSKGDVVFQTSAIGNIALQAGATPANAILLQNQGGSIRFEANGAMGMIEMLATKEISATALKINLN